MLMPLLCAGSVAQPARSAPINIRASPMPAMSSPPATMYSNTSILARNANLHVDPYLLKMTLGTSP